jgi:uncharacterized protein with NAD-binding domain and iron-sulfur cluster
VLGLISFIETEFDVNAGLYRHEVDIYEGRQWIGGKVASYVDKDGNHIEVRVFGWPPH